MRIKELTAKNAAKDIFTGIIISLVSIPISMGYAQVSGLPVVYGLYGSIFPILVFGLLSTSKHFIFGVDAAPAALVGAFLAAAGIEGGSEEAVRVIPVISLCVGIWLLLMALFRAGRVVAYISTPVMGGFISGISATIIFMQIPKLLGGTSGRGEIDELVKTAIDTDELIIVGKHKKNDENSSFCFLNGVHRLLMPGDNALERPCRRERGGPP